MEENKTQINLSHHTRHEYCTNRLKYRDGRISTAVKVYTVVNESKHLLIFGVPKINLHREVKQLLGKYGKLKLVRMVTSEIAVNSTVTIEQFTDVYHVAFEKIYCARRAKKFMDAKTFYGGILHISYAPEYEDINEIREKFKLRKSEIKFRIRKNREFLMKSLKRKSDENDCEHLDNSSELETIAKKRRNI